MNKEKKYELAKWAVGYAQNNGAQQVSVSIANSKSSSVAVRNKKIDTLEQAIERSLSIRLFVNNRYSTHSTNRLEKDALKHFINNAIEATRFLAEDSFRSLPEEGYCYKGDKNDLKTIDLNFEQILPQTKIDLAFDLEKEILHQDDRIVAVTTGYQDGIAEKVMVASNGFEGDLSNSYYGLHAEVSAKDLHARPEAMWTESNIFYDKLPKTGIGTIALQRVLSKMGQQKIASARLPMIVENRQVSRLLSPILQALKGANIQQQNSFLINKINQKVLSDKITIVDNPFIVSGRGSAYFDNEGMATKKRNIFEAGVLKNYYISWYYAQKMGIPPTNGSTTNLVFQLGTKNQDKMIEELERGILVTGFNGGNCNGTTGDYSYGVEGFLIENGKIVQPISEMNITGNMIDLWSDIGFIGNDAYENSSWQTPSILFNNVDFSGI